jgi:hypothetical protein
MYFHASYTLSPAILHILPHNFTMVSPLDRQLNKGNQIVLLLELDEKYFQLIQMSRYYIFIVLVSADFEDR